MQEVDKIIELINYWKSYTEKGLAPKLDRFAAWLNNQLNTTTVYQGLPPKPEFRKAGLDAYCGFLLGSLISYTETWTKLAFQDVPIVSLHDFGILKYIEQEKNPTKNQISQQAVLESSTCFEILKRLKKEKIIDEFHDPKDRRVHRVSLTSRGQKIMQKATEKMQAMSKLLMGELDQESKLTLMKLLHKLVDFHADVYQNVDRDKLKINYNL